MLYIGIVLYLLALPNDFHGWGAVSLLDIEHVIQNRS